MTVAVLPKRNGLTLPQAVAQRAVLDAFAHSPMVLLTGHAGAGKTWLISKLVQQWQFLPSPRSTWVESPHSVCVSAPTHKALQNLRDKISGSVDFATVHSLLGLRLTEDDDGLEFCESSGSSRLADYAMIVIDEVSMLDQFMLDRLRSLRGSTKILFVGDPAQLPPVNQPASPVFLQMIPTVHLDGVVRQQHDSPILSLATAIRKSIGRFPLDALNDFHLPIIGTHEVIPAFLEAYGDQNMVRALAWRNQRVQQLNQDIFHSVYGQQPSAAPFAEGQTVVFHKPYRYQGDDETRTVHTSAEAIVSAVYDCATHPFWENEIPSFLIRLTLANADSLHGYVPQDESRRLAVEAEARRIAKAARDEPTKESYRGLASRARHGFLQIRHAFASTIHKSQGSTYHTAIVDVDDLNECRDNDLFNRLLYTAVTRPSIRLILARQSRNFSFLYRNHGHA